MLELCIFAILRYIYDILKKQASWNSNFHTSIYRFLSFAEAKLKTRLTLQLKRTEVTNSNGNDAKNFGTGISPHGNPVLKKKIFENPIFEKLWICQKLASGEVSATLSSVHAT